MSEADKTKPTRKPRVLMVWDTKKDDKGVTQWLVDYRLNRLVRHEVWRPEKEMKAIIDQQDIPPNYVVKQAVIIPEQPGKVRVFWMGFTDHTIEDYELFQDMFTSDTENGDD